jgi:hypothetical protein
VNVVRPPRERVRSHDSRTSSVRRDRVLSPVPRTFSSYLSLAGCAVLLAAVTALALALGRALPVVILATVGVLVGVEGFRRARRRALIRRFHNQFARPKDLLLVFTDSPHWLPRIEQEWLPRWGERAVLFNRSGSWSAQQVEAKLWRAFGGYVEHTPLAIVLPRRGKPSVVRFFLAFRDFKHGKPARLLKAEQELKVALAAATDSDEA